MNAAWEVDSDSLALWKGLLASCQDEDLPRRRREKNVRRRDIDISKGEIWRVLVGCQVTTQQRSGPNSAASRFMQSSSRALSLRKCRAEGSLRPFLEKEFTSAGLRRAPTMAANLERIFTFLESGEWRTLLKNLATLQTNTTLRKERDVVRYLVESKNYPGLGQKQSRNFIQWLGLSRYEIPLDSRVLKKMEEFGASFVPRGPALSDEAVYLFVQDGLQMIAKRLDVYPCELDACIFASFDIRADEVLQGDDGDV